MTFIRTGFREPFDFESITVSGTVVTLTASKLSPSGVQPPISALLSLETAAIRYRLDEVDPTTSEGHLLTSGDVLLLESITALRQFKAIKDTDDDATLKVSYFH